MFGASEEKRFAFHHPAEIVSPLTTPEIKLTPHTKLNRGYSAQTALRMTTLVTTTLTTGVKNSDTKNL